MTRWLDALQWRYAVLFTLRTADFEPLPPEHPDE